MHSRTKNIDDQHSRLLIQWFGGKENLLDRVHPTRLDCRLHSSPLVGTRGDDSHRRRELVGSVQE